LQKNVANLGLKGYGKLKEQDIIETSEEYLNYYREIGDDFISITSSMKSVSSYMPTGTKEYFEFIFKSVEAFKGGLDIVNNHAGKINKLSKEVFDKLGKAIGGNEKNLWSGRRILKAGGDAKAMNAEWGIK